MKKLTNKAGRHKIDLKALKESEARFRSIVLWSPDAIIVTDAKGKIEYMNPAAERVFNRKVESFIGKDFGLPLVDGESTEIDIFRSEKDPGVGDMHVVEAEWLNKKAHLIIIRDITERKRGEEETRRLYEELKALDRLKDEFVSTVSHELRTPLATFQCIIQSLLGGIFGDFTKEQKEYLEMAKEEAQREAHLINNLLDLAKLESGKVELHRKGAKVSALAEEIVSSMRPQADEKKVALLMEIPGDLPEVLVDPGRIKEVFSNLLSNALKFSQAGGKVTISAGPTDNGQLKVAVSDTGIGISRENIPKMFSKFYQVEQTNSPGSKGTGLGLAICKEIIGLHGGKIWVESEPDKGSTFSFTLPIGKEE